MIPFADLLAALPLQPPPPDTSAAAPAAALASPFALYRLADTDTLLHLIDLETYFNSLKIKDMTHFFADFSDHAQPLSYRVVHLWEDVWRQRPVLVLSRLRALMGQSVRIPARLTELRRIDRNTAATFLADNHLQAGTNTKYNYGLWLPNRYFRVLPDDFNGSMRQGNPTEWLVAVATFAQPRTIPRHGIPTRSFELVRFANRLDTTVVGGLDKLLRGFMNEHTRPDLPERATATDLMTYADRDWSDGRSYARLGFEQMGQTAPHHFWLDPATMTRYYPNRLPVDDPISAGFLPIVNAGSRKFVRLCNP